MDDATLDFVVEHNVPIPGGRPQVVINAIRKFDHDMQHGDSFTISRQHFNKVSNALRTHVRRTGVRYKVVTATTWEGNGREHRIWKVQR